MKERSSGRKASLVWVKIGTREIKAGWFTR